MKLICGSCGEYVLNSGFWGCLLQSALCPRPFPGYGVSFLLLPETVVFMEVGRKWPEGKFGLL